MLPRRGDRDRLTGYPTEKHYSSARAGQCHPKNERRGGD